MDLWVGTGFGWVRIVSSDGSITGEAFLDYLSE
jgi:hypothetical protein